MDLVCGNCNAVYHLPDCGEGKNRVCFDLMQVLSEPFVSDEHVWFWSEKDRVLYLNLSCKEVLDIMFLRRGQSVSGRGSIQRMNVHVKWRCEACGAEAEIDRKIPCLVNEETKIRLEKSS